MIIKLILFMQIQFCLWNQATASSATNVALNKRGLYCIFRQLSEKVFDGITDIQIVESLTESCRKNAYINVHLTYMFSIQYVVVYEGRGNNTGQLDYFIVFRISGDKKGKCSEYPRPSIGAVNGSGMRVNCKPSIKLFSEVQIDSRKSEGFYISEIEVHSLGSPNENILIYRGCFNSFEDSERQSDEETCTVRCMAQGYLLTAFKNMTECYCGRSYDNSHEIPASECGIKCYDRDYFCGGVEAYSVYLIQVILPSYQGCMELEDPEDVYTDPDMTIEKCLQYCDDSLFALLFFSENCVCKNHVEEVSDLLYKSCTARCNGNFEDFCGGERAASVFKTCKRIDRDLSCDWLVRCNGTLDMYGNCIGTCLPTFKGEFCIEKDSHIPSTSSPITTVPYTYPPSTSTLSTTSTSQTLSYTNQNLPINACNSSNPCENHENTECIEHQGKAYCECLLGYTLNRSNMKCEDINECDYEPCDDSLSTCKNIEGSMTCNCKRGFVSTADFCIRNETSSDLTEFFNKAKIVFLLMALPPLISIFIMAFLIWYHEPLISNE